MDNRLPSQHVEQPHTVTTPSWIETNSDDGRSERRLPSTPSTPSAPAYLTLRRLSETSHKPGSWNPSFWSRFPVTGIAALAGAALLTCAAVAVLVLSNQQQTPNWGYDVKPTVYLSLATALKSILLTYALAEGVVISLWRNALRKTIAAATKTSLAGSVQSVPYKGTSTQIFYVTNYHYTIIAAALSFLGMLAVIPTFWGWWEDGHNVSMSPLEIAKAFDAHLLSITDSNATANNIISHMGERRIKDGELTQIGGPEIDGFTRRRAK